MIFTDSILLRKICRRASGLFLPPPQENRRFSESLWYFFRKNPTRKARQTAGMRYNYLKLDLVVFRVGERSRTNPTSKLWEKKCIQEQKKSAFSQKTP